MNSTEIVQLNVVPDGKEAWLTYDNYLELKRLFEAAPLPSNEESTDNLQYLYLHRFLTKIAGLDLSRHEQAIHFNAFALIRRGYKIELITDQEYERLTELMTNLEQPAEDDVDLYETGRHRELYDYLTKMMGLSVQKGRGPAWHRAAALIKKHKLEQEQK